MWKGGWWILLEEWNSVEGSMVGLSSRVEQRGIGKGEAV